MPKCKYCGEQISRVADRDVCPWCGGFRPLDDVDNSTQDYTKAFDPIKGELEEVKHKSKVVTAVLAMTVGVFGAHAFYIGRKYLGLILMAITAVLVAGLGCILYFTCLPNALAFLIPYFAEEILMIFTGAMILTRHDNKDAHGEFLK